MGIFWSTTHESLYRTEPATTKFCTDGETPRFRYASCAMQGWRANMEDAHLTIPNLHDSVSLFGVFDGHGGPEVAILAKNSLPKILTHSSHFKAKNYKAALAEAFLEIDRQFIYEWQRTKTEEEAYRKEHVGSTACVALVTETEIYVANCGDSRCVLSKNGSAFQMSLDHKPSLEEERKRIAKAGGKIEAGRVNGVLSLTRSLGDLDLKKNPELSVEKQLIIPVPDIRVEKLSRDVDFLMVACDGIWDCMSSQKAVDFVTEQLKGKVDKLSKVIAKLFNQILAAEIDENYGGMGSDNMTCVLVQFNK